MADGNEEFLTTRELAQLLRVKERKVYELVANAQVPCTRATGKLLFPRNAIDRWLSENGTGHGLAAPAARPGVVLGSHDPLLDWALRESRSGLASFFDGSLDGVDRFADGAGIAAGLHIYDAAERSWNISAVSERFRNKPVVLMQWVWRERGLIIRPEDRNRIKKIADIGLVRVVPRQPEAGSQKLFEQLLSEAGIDIKALSLAPVARTETEVAAAVNDGAADVAFGLETSAKQCRLAFVPILRERFDLLVDRRAWFEPPLQAFFAFCRTDAFSNKAQELGGYRLDGAETIHFNGAA